MISRAATLTPVATAAMPLVWEVLFYFFGNTPLWLHVHCTNAGNNGRLAYFLLRHHIMGPVYLTAQSTRIEETVNSLVHNRGDKGLQVLINALSVFWARVDETWYLGRTTPMMRRNVWILSSRLFNTPGMNLWRPSSMPTAKLLVRLRRVPICYLTILSAHLRSRPPHVLSMTSKR